MVSAEHREATEPPAFSFWVCTKTRFLSLWPENRPAEFPASAMYCLDLMEQL